jgi:hypothetical protein
MYDVTFLFSVGTEDFNKYLIVYFFSAVRNLTVDFFGSGEVWIDGVKQSLSNYKNWRKSDTVLLPENAHVIAVRSVFTPCGRGSNLVIASDDYIVSDASWKCKACQLTDDSFAAG